MDKSIGLWVNDGVQMIGITDDDDLVKVNNMLNDVNANVDDSVERMTKLATEW